MAQQVLPIIGAVVGGYFGGPSGAQAGWAIGAAVGGAVAASEPKPGPRLGELPVQTSYEGSPRAIIYGTATCTGYVLAFGPPIKTTEIETGDKGAPKSENEVVYRSYAIAICEGPITGVLRIWENDKLVYDVRPGSLMVAESQKWLASGGGTTFYLGDEEQVPDIFMALNVSGLGETPGYSGTAYMFRLLADTTDTRGAIQQYRFEVCSSGWMIYDLQRTTGVQVVRWFNAGALSSGGTWHVNESGESIHVDGAALLIFEVRRSSTSPGLPWAGLTATLTVQVGDDAEYTKILSSDTVFSIQVNGPSDVVARIEMHNGSGVSLGNALAQISVNNILTSGTIGPGYQAYYGGETPPPFIPGDIADEYYGVLQGADSSLWAAPWGPDSIEITGDGLPVTLSSVVSNLHGRAAVSASDFDVSEIEDIEIKGLTLQSDGYSAADAISTLQDCYFFDKQEDGEKIRYPLRGKPVITTLTIDDLVETPDLSKREQAGEIPRKVNLMYQNPLAGYAPVKATFEASSPDNKSTLEISTQVAVVLDVDEAQQMVHKVFKVAVSDAQGEIKLSVPDSFIALCPGDCIGLSLRGRVIRLRIEEVEWADGVMNLTCRTDRQSAYTSALTGIPIPEPALPPSTIAGDTQFAYLDIPARIDSEDDLHYLVAGTSAMPGWYGWALQRSLDGGLNFSSVDTWNDRAVMGTLVDPVAAASEHYTDTTNTVRVQLYRTTQVIESQTEQQFLSEGGAFAIVRPDGSAEVMQYLDADDEGDGVFALTTLHRGLLNTGGSAHLEGSLFVMLSSAKHVTAQSAWLGMDLTHRAVSLGESPETADIQTDAFVGRSQIEWPVAYLDAQRDLSDVLTVSWLPRHRFGSDVNPIASVNFQGFRVTFDDGATSVSFDTTGTTYAYDASAMGSSVEVSVAPINRITGLGPVESVIA